MKNVSDQKIFLFFYCYGIWQGKTAKNLCLFSMTRMASLGKFPPDFFPQGLNWQVSICRKSFNNKIYWFNSLHQNFDASKVLNKFKQYWFFWGKNDAELVRTIGWFESIIVSIQTCFTLWKVFQRFCAGWSSLNLRNCHRSSRKL